MPVQLSASNRGEAILCMPQNGFRLIALHAGEPRQEFIEPRTVFQILEERLHRHACSFKHPGTAHLARNSLDRWTLLPIKHEFKAYSGLPSRASVQTCEARRLLIPVPILTTHVLWRSVTHGPAKDAGLANLDRYLEDLE
jgi:hypothetical protein